MGGASQDPLVLVRQGRSVVDRLRAGGMTNPESAHLTLDAESLATSVESRVLTLEAALGAVSQEARDAQLTLVAKQRAMSEFDAVFRAVATSLEGLFGGAGLPERAVRRSAGGEARLSYAGSSSSVGGGGFLVGLGLG